MAPSRIIVFRHGDRPFRSASRDVQLNEVGIKQSLEAGNFSTKEDMIPWEKTKILSSPYYRTVQTAMNFIIGAKPYKPIKICIEPGFGELRSFFRNHGKKYEVYSSEQLSELLPPIRPYYRGVDTTYKPVSDPVRSDGEDDSECQARVNTTMRRLIRTCEEKYLVIFTHAAPHGFIARYLLKDKKLRFKIGTCSMSAFVLNGEGIWESTHLGSTHHLSAGRIHHWTIREYPRLRQVEDLPQKAKAAASDAKRHAKAETKYAKEDIKQARDSTRKAFHEAFEKAKAQIQTKDGGAADDGDTSKHQSKSGKTDNTKQDRHGATTEDRHKSQTVREDRHTSKAVKPESPELKAPKPEGSHSKDRSSRHQQKDHKGRPIQSEETSRAKAGRTSQQQQETDIKVQATQKHGEKGNSTDKAPTAPASPVLHPKSPLVQLGNNGFDAATPKDPAVIAAAAAAKKHEEKKVEKQPETEAKMKRVSTSPELAALKTDPKDAKTQLPKLDTNIRSSQPKDSPTMPRAPTKAERPPLQRHHSQPSPTAVHQRHRIPSPALESPQRQRNDPSRQAQSKTTKNEVPARPKVERRESAPPKTSKPQERREQKAERPKVDRRASNVAENSRKA